MQSMFRAPIVRQVFRFQYLMEEVLGLLSCITKIVFNAKTLQKIVEIQAKDNLNCPQGLFLRTRQKSMLQKLATTIWFLDILSQRPCFTKKLLALARANKNNT